MELFSEYDIKFILQQCELSKTDILCWSINDYSNKLVGYLGEHLSLIVHIDSGGVKSQLKFFVKCMPRFEEWKANYLRETTFFNKEYIMLSRLFKDFRECKGLRIWRPKLYLVKKELFVFEDVTQMKYMMPSNLSTLTYDEIMATAAALARFHAQSYIHEEHKSKLLNRSYRIWEEYAEFLCEPSKGKSWRDTGMRAAIDFLKVFSQYKSKHNFEELVEGKISELFYRANDLMKPSLKYRNVVVHRDVWSNNIFLKNLGDSRIHALVVDFQTVLYCDPTLDISSMIYFNTTKHFRDKNTDRIIDYYYDVLSHELELENVDIKTIITKNQLIEAFEESIVFGMTQAALIVPIIAMTDERRKEFFGDSEHCAKINVVSRSQEFIDLANENEMYKNRVIELLDDIVRTFMYPSINNVDDQ